MHFTATRYHDISCGHRVFGHESKCAHLHGHNYRIHFHCEAIENYKLDDIGRVVDFSVIKALLCMWPEEHWDHKFLMWEQDPDISKMLAVDPKGVVAVPFNPTAENMAAYLVNHVAPKILFNTGIRLVRCDVEETRKCSASYGV